VKIAQKKISKEYTEDNPMTGRLLISEQILQPIKKLPSFTNWDNVIDIHSEEGTAYTALYQEAYLKYVEDE
jgi:hypothetical protein